MPITKSSVELMNGAIGVERKMDEARAAGIDFSAPRFLFAATVMDECRAVSKKGMNRSGTKSGPE